MRLILACWPLILALICTINAEDNNGWSWNGDDTKTPQFYTVEDKNHMMEDLQASGSENTVVNTTNVDQVCHVGHLW